jgi:hypothetical protein
VPVWVFWLLGAAAVALVAIVTYFLTSSQAKARAAAFKEKALKMVEILKERVDRLERAKKEAAAAREAAEQRARSAERTAEAAGDEARAHRAQAAGERERAERAERAVRDLEERLREAQAQRTRWEGEARTADQLAQVASEGLSFAAVLTLRGIVAQSALLSSHRMRPEGALEELDECLRQAQRTSEVEAEHIAALLANLLAIRSAT